MIEYMFAKKIEYVQAEAEGLAKQLFKDKHLNHEFFLLVRDHKYEQARALGAYILAQNKKNEAILKFCNFIDGNRDQLRKMVEEQTEYTDESSEEGEESEEQDSLNDSEGESISAASRSSVSSSFSSKSSKSGSGRKILQQKQNMSKCAVHHWDHMCKNQKCPNRSK